MTDFKAMNSFLSDYLAYSGLLVFRSEKDRRSYHLGTHCYVMCPICGAKTSCEMIKGIRRFKSWQCSHLSSSSPLDFFMIARGIDNLSAAIRETEKLMNTGVSDCRRTNIFHHIPSDKTEALRKKNIELVESAFSCSKHWKVSEYLRIRGIDCAKLPETVLRDIAYADHLEQISQSTGKPFFISGVLFRNRYCGDISFTVRRTEGNGYVQSGFRVLQIGRILPFGLNGCVEAETVAITEGAFDALSLYAAGLQSFSISGIGNIGKAVDFIPGSCRRVIIALDNDEAGEKASSALAELLSVSGIHSEQLKIEKGKDTNEWLCCDPKGFYEAVRKEKA